MDKLNFNPLAAAEISEDSYVVKKILDHEENEKVVKLNRSFFEKRLDLSFEKQISSPG